jgi:hypothetical protein
MVSRSFFLAWGETGLPLLQMSYCSQRTPVISPSVRRFTALSRKRCSPRLSGRLLPATFGARGIERAAAAIDARAAGKVISWAGSGSSYERRWPLIWPDELLDVFAPPTRGDKSEMPSQFCDAMRGDTDWSHRGDGKLDLTAMLPANARSIVDARNFLWKAANLPSEICPAVLAAWPYLGVTWL